MQPFVFPAILTALTVTAASAGPLDLNPSADPSSSSLGMPSRSFQPTPLRGPAQLPAEPVPERAQLAAVDGPNLGGGFLELLFGGFDNRNAAPAYRSDPTPQRGYAGPGDPTVSPRFMKQEVAYDGNERP